jgi:hypothetical protein
VKLSFNPLMAIILIGLVVPATAIGRFIVSFTARMVRRKQNSISHER